MALSSLGKLIVAVASGASIVTPVALYLNSTSQKTDSIPATKQQSEEDCQLVLEDVSQHLKLLVCTNSTNFQEVFYLRENNSKDSPKKLVKGAKKSKNANEIVIELTEGTTTYNISLKDEINWHGLPQEKDILKICGVVAMQETNNLVCHSRDPEWKKTFKLSSFTET